MSQWASKRKRNILIVIAIIVLIVASYTVLTVAEKEPTCFDRIQNGTETGIDCGGDCVRVCREEAQGLIIWWERPFKVANGVYNTVAYIENQNLYSGLQKMEYEFRLYDKENILVTQPVTGTTFIEPNKRSAVFASGITTGDNEVFTVFFKVLSLQDWERVPNEFSYNLFNVGEPILTNQDTAPKLSAPVANKTFFDFVDIPVVVILYNQKGNAIASSQTFIDSIPQGQTEQVFYSWPEPFGEAVSRIEIIPRIDPFLNRGLAEG
jgi:hypothetical protein